MSKFYALCLLIACLAAAMLGYALGGQINKNPPSESVTDAQTVEEYGIEAQGSYLAYEQEVAEIVNDRKTND